MRKLPILNPNGCLRPFCTGNIANGVGTIMPKKRMWQYSDVFFRKPVIVKKNPEWSGVWFVWNSLDGKLYYEKREDLRGNYKQRIAKPVYQDGKRYAYTHEGLAACLSLSIYQVQRLFREKKLEGTYHMEKRTTVFDLDAVEKIIKQLKIRTK